MPQPDNAGHASECGLLCRVVACADCSRRGSGSSCRSTEDGSMTGDRRSEPPFAVVEAKIRRPVHREGLVARTRLLGALAATPERIPLILVTAPAGYGKTIALSQWATADTRAFAWVTVDEADGDPVRLAGHVALALHRVQ